MRQPMIVTLRTVTGQGIAPWLDDVARLRMAVFRDFPYLYEGDFAYEQQYLATYAQSPRSLFVLAEADGRVVGAATGVPLADEEPAFQAPFIQAGLAVEDVFYFGESVLLPVYRGEGLGHRFFDAREAYARQLGAHVTAFCAVQRPETHPRRPVGYRPLDAFWRGRGYVPRPDMLADYSWRDLDEDASSPKPMMFWLRYWS